MSGPAAAHPAAPMGGDGSQVPLVVTVRPLATPLPMSFLALALASLTFSAVELRWVPVGQEQVAALVALVVTAPLQGFASVLGFWTRDPVAGTGCALLAGSWATIGAVSLIGPPGTHSPGLGLFLVGAAVALVVPVASGWSKLLAALVMGASGVRFALTGVYELSAGAAWRDTAAVFGLVLSLLALYAALAFELEGVHQRTVLPTWRSGASARALSQGAHADRDRLDREPGVRDQL